MTYRDPRLTNEALLRLAVYRLTHGPPPPPDWRQGAGLSALLDAARRLPPVEPWDLPGVYENAPGFGHLLWQARQWQEDHP